VFEKSVSEPIKDRGEANEAKEGLGQFVVAGGDAAVDFDSAEKVFDLMAAPIVTPVEAGRLATTAPGWNAATGALGAEAGAEDISIEAFVSDDPTAASTGQHRFDCVLVVLRSGSDTERHGPAARVDEGRELGVQSALGPAHRLRRLPASGIGAMLMELDVRAIQMPQLAHRTLGQHGKHPGEQSAFAPASIAGVDRLPRSITLGQIAPRHTGSQHEEDRAEHQSVILRRPTTSSSPCANLPSPDFSARIRSIFLAAPSAAQESADDPYRTWSGSDSCANRRFRHFSNTP